MILRCCIFLAFLLANAGFGFCAVQYGSLGFVIDDTVSMEKEIRLVRDAVEGIMDIIVNKSSSQIKDVVLVTFNDPSWLTKLYETESEEKLKKALDGIKVHGGGDCPEYAFSGLQLALENSRRNSYLFVFTDAPPKDAHRMALLNKTARSKETQIIFIRTTPGSEKCKEIPERDFAPYYEVAAHTCGQVFSCSSKREVEDLLKYVKLIISGRSSVITCSNEIPPNKLTVIPFNVDDQAEYVVVSASGLNVELALIEGPTRDYEKITWINNAKVMKIDNPQYGAYKVSVKGSSSTSISIFARTDFTFLHGFSETEPPAFNNDRKEPTDRTLYHLLVNVSDPTNSVNIQSAQILTKDGKILLEMPLTKKSDDFYITDKFISPTSTFLIAIKGIGRETRKEIRRIGSLIDSRAKDTDPKIAISGRLDLEYDETLQLYCNVNGYPKPNIFAWKDEIDKNLPDKLITHIDRYRQVNRLKIDHMKKSRRLYCYANNGRGDTNVQVDVVVKSPIVVGDKNPTQTATRELEYDKPSTLYCDVRSKFPMQITWYFNDKVIGNSDKYTVLNGGTELKINKVTEAVEGRYKCTAWLVDDKETTTELVTVVKTNGIPPIFGKPEQITVREKQSAIVKCNILKAYPEPKITWQVKKAGEAYFQNLPALNKPELSISNANLQHSGVYKCIAQNPVGKAEQDIKVDVLVSPKISFLVNNVEVKSGKVPFRSTVTLGCRVTSHGPPNISWRHDRTEAIHPRSAIKTKEFEYISYVTIEKFTTKDTFYCEATNDVDRAVGLVSVEPNDPFIDNVNNRNNDVKTYDYGKPATLHCDIKSDFGMKITWYHQRPGASLEEVSNSAKYSIMSDGRELKINNVKEGDEGKFTCKAWLVENKDITRTHDFKININPVAPVLGKPEVVSVKENNPAVLKCDIILAYPKPKIVWQFKRTGEATFRTLANEHQEELRIARADLQKSGEYKCLAQNSKGHGEKVSTLIVQISPRVTLLLNDVELSSKELKYDASYVLTCRVTSHKVPEIVWKNSHGQIKQGKPDHVVNTFEYDSILRVANFRKDDTFSCEAINDVSRTSKSVRVTVDSPLKPTPPTTIKLKYGEAGTIKCGVTSSFPTKYTWSVYKSGKTTTIDGSEKIDYSISKDGSELTIKKMGVELQGEYHCKAMLLADFKVQQEHKTTVTVELEIPEIRIQPADFKLRIGDKAVMECQIIKGNPQPKLSWFKKDKLGKKQALGESGILTVTKTTYEDDAEYTCVATNIAGKHVKVAKLTVEGPPMIQSKISEVKGVEGDVSLRVPCEVDGNPKPTVSWLADNVKISPDAGYVIEENALVINQPKEMDAILFTCVVENKFGNDNNTVLVTVSKAIEEDNFGNISYVYLKAGDTKELLCYSGSQPGRWFKDIWDSNIKGTYRIVNANKDEHDGNYTCRISTKEESYSKTYVVDVGYEPYFATHKDPFIPIYWSGEAVNLDCQVNMKPSTRTTKVEWFVNGELSPTTSFVYNEAVWGNHTCRISNVHGSVTRTYFVKSSMCLIERSLLQKTNLPVMLDPSGTVPNLASTSKYILLERNSKLYLTCHNQPGVSNKPNTFKALPDKNELLVTCDNEDTFTVEGKPMKFNQLECQHDVEPKIQRTGKLCADNKNSELIQIGYDISENRFIDVYTVCFDKNSKLPINARTIMTRSYSKSVILPKWLSMNDFANENQNQKACDSEAACCTAKKQLVNDQDVWQGAPQYATFIDGLNTVPIWNNCKGKIAWSKVEEQATSYYLTKTSKIETLTGALEYTRNGDGMMVPRFLYKSIWKVTVRRKSFAVVVVWVNDPHPTAADIRCSSTCDKYGLSSLAGDPYTYCCNLTEFEAKFT